MRCCSEDDASLCDVRAVTILSSDVAEADFGKPAGLFMFRLALLLELLLLLLLSTRMLVSGPPTGFLVGKLVAGGLKSSLGGSGGSCLATSTVDFVGDFGGETGCE